MIASYRDPRYAASIRIEQLCERARGRTDAVPEVVVDVHARRVARTAAGGVAIAGFVAMAAASLANAVGAFGGADRVSPTLVLIGTVTLALATYVVARVVTAHTFEARVRSSFDASGDELSRLARLEEDSVGRAAARLAGRRERLSIALPMVGISLLAPLTMHLVLWCLLGGGRGLERWLDAFDWWIGASLVLVGVAHVALAVQCAIFARRVEEASMAELAAGSPMSGWRALGWTAVASLVPGLIAVAIPPVVVLVTGVLFIPRMFSSMHLRALAERQTLSEA